MNIIDAHAALVKTLKTPVSLFLTVKFNEKKLYLR